MSVRVLVSGGVYGERGGLDVSIEVNEEVLLIALINAAAELSRQLKHVKPKLGHELVKSASLELEVFQCRE